MNRHSLSGSVIAAAVTLAAIAGCQTDTRSIGTVRAEGDRHYDRGQYAQARAEYEEYIERHQSNAEVRFRLGRSLLEIGEPARAREHLAIATSQAPMNDLYFTTLVDALIANGEREEAMFRLRQRAQEFQRTDDYLRYGRYALDMGDPDEAERALLVAARFDGGESLEPQVALADLYEAIGDRPSAVMRLRMAHYVDPDNQAVRDRLFNLGIDPGPTARRRPAEMP